MQKRRAGQARDRDQLFACVFSASLVAQSPQLTRHFGAEQLARRRPEIARPRGAQDRAPVGGEYQSNLGIAECVRLQHRADERGLGGGGPLVLSTGGDPLEKAFNQHRGSRPPRLGMRRARATGQDLQRGTQVATPGAAGDRDVCDGGDGRQRLAPKAQRLQALQIVGGSDLAGRMPVDRRRQLVGWDTAAVVRHLDAAVPAVGDVNRYRAQMDERRHVTIRRAGRREDGIDRVFDELLHDVRRSRHDLARCDLGDDLGGELTDRQSLSS